MPCYQFIAARTEQRVVLASLISKCAMAHTNERIFRNGNIDSNTD
jgi:hypothetical protein